MTPETLRRARYHAQMLERIIELLELTQRHESRRAARYDIEGMIGFLREQLLTACAAERAQGNQEGH
jgi:hypothetical protein